MLKIYAINLDKRSDITIHTQGFRVYIHGEEP